ncbi:MAG TPA: hypothetical protein VFM79_09000 [Pelobium sp.]|nr:hypothetical protein [Pelobium sp.]
MKKENIDYYIGIDPGTITGIAVWDTKEQKFDMIKSGGILEMMNSLTFYTCWGNNIFIIENPNLRKWYGKNTKGKDQGAGSIKRDYKIWVEWFAINGCKFQEINPKDVVTKLTSQNFKALTGWTERTNSHARDAAMMVFKKG